MIRLENIHLRQGDFELRELSLELAAGEYAVLMGRSGCGKTTLLEAVCGLRKIVGGKIILGDREVSALPPAERGVGFVPQDRALFPTQPVREQLAFALVLRSLGQAEIAGQPDGYVRCQFAGAIDGSARERIFAAANERGWTLRELSRKAPSLEDLFVSLTQEKEEPQ